MGNIPNTAPDNACSFPFVNYTTGACDTTCAAYLGGSYTALTAIMLLISGTTLLYFIWMMRYIGVELFGGVEGAKKNHHRALKRTLEFWFFAGLTSLFTFLSNIDNLGWGGIISAPVEEFLLGLVIPSIIGCLFAIVDFWIRLASIDKNQLKRKWVMYVLAYFNTLLFTSLQISIPENYRIFDGIKLITFALITLGGMVVAMFPIRAILHTLDQTGSLKASSGEVNQENLQRIRRMKNKFRLFYFLCVLGVVGLVVSAQRSLTVGATSFAWQVPCVIGFGTILNRAIHAVACIMCLVFFLPQNRSKATGAGSTISSTQKRGEVTEQDTFTTNNPAESRTSLRLLVRHATNPDMNSAVVSASQ